MTPGTHPQRVSRNTMSTDPHPRSITANGGKKMARRTRKTDILWVIFEGFQCPTELVGARRSFIAAADAIQFANDIIDFLTCHQTTDPLQVTVATAIKGDLPDDAFVIDGHIDELRAGALGFVEGVFHNISFCHSSSCIFCRSRRGRDRCGRFYSFWRRALPLRDRRMGLPPTHHSPIVARPPA